MNGPDQRAFEADVAKAAFRLGEGEGRWRLIETAWPYAFIAVTAKDGSEYVLRLDCAGVPTGAADRRSVGCDSERSAGFRPVAARPRGTSIRGLPYRLEGRHGAISAV